MKKFLIIVLFFVSVNIFGQFGKWFPDNLTFRPFEAYFLEPRMGFMFEQNKNDIRLNIGSSMDIYRREIDNKQWFSFGADMFTYTLLRGEKDFHFPVDAVDYLFGFNSSYVNANKGKEYGARLRFSHISAHFVDGHYDGTTASWKNGRNPQVYSREFFELLAYYKFLDIRFYGGATYIIHIDPLTIGKDIYHFGFEYFSGPLFDFKLYPFIAYDLRIFKIDQYDTNNTIVLGVKIGEKNSKGFRIYYEYYKGKNIHGEYFDLNEEYSAFGFNLEF